jgi:predicted amidophosphoribosyltransferase
MPAPKRILTCRRCAHDLEPLIDTPWIRACPECGTPFDPDFLYEGRPAESPEPNTLPPEPPARND